MADRVRRGGLRVHRSDPAVLPIHERFGRSDGLVGLGAAVAIRWLVRDRHGPTLVTGALGAVVVVASLGFVLNDGLENRWVSESNQWANQQVPEFEFGLDLILDGLERLLTMTHASGFDR